MVAVSLSELCLIPEDSENYLVMSVSSDEVLISFPVGNEILVIHNIKLY